MGRSMNDQAALELCVARRTFHLQFDVRFWADLRP
jgi:hypothetical protein